MAEALVLESRRLRERIWNAFPVTQPAFGKLLSLLEIEASHTIPTAAVTLGTRSRLLINPAFTQAHCSSDQALIMLVLHELFHVVLGHTRLYAHSTPTLNFAFDAVINAQLCLLFPGPEWTGLFRELYDAQASPWALLRPPEGWQTTVARWLPGALGALHRRLYTDASLSYEDLFRLLADGALEVQLGDLGSLLGSHDGGGGKDQGEALDPDLLAEVRAIIAEWPMVEARSGRDQGGAERAFRLAHRDRKLTAVGVLRQALRDLSEQVGSGRGKPRIVAAASSMIFPNRMAGDRRAAVLEACGGEPLLFMGEGVRPSCQRGERVHVYLDVSGSMNGVIAPLYAALTRLTTWMTPKLHLFSTSVKDITQEELRRGVGATTDGTNISVVTSHMVQHGIRRALVVTDGWVGRVPSEHMAELARRKGRFGVVLSAGGDPAFAQDLSARVWQLPNLDKESR